jgi:hypothetical protein
MPFVNKTLGMGLIAACTTVIVLAFALYGLFHGYFDHGDFSVLSTQRSSSGRFAMVAKRSDNDALNNDEIFVVMGDHIFSPVELRYALHGPSVIFSTDHDCITLKWQDPLHLEISCAGNTISKDEINGEQSHSDNVSIKYVNIADVNSTPSPK